MKPISNLERCEYFTPRDFVVQFLREPDYTIVPGLLGWSGAGWYVYDRRVHTIDGPFISREEATHVAEKMYLSGESSDENNY